MAYTTELHIGGLLKWNAIYRPHHLGVKFGSQKLSFRKYNNSVNQLGHAFLATDLDKGDKVVSFLPNCLELMEFFWACAATGLVAVPLSPLVREQGLINLINNSEAKLIITTKELVQHIVDVLGDLPEISKKNIWLIDETSSEFVSYHEQKKNKPTSDLNTELNGDDPYNIIYSSGTTGLPKGIVHTHFIRSMYGSLFSNYFRITPESVVLHTGALIFNGAFLTFMPSMFMGATYILHKQFDAKALVKEIIESKVTHIVMVPSQIISVLKEPDFTSQNLTSLEFILSVGAPLLSEYKQELKQRTGGVFYELYGLTEGFVTILDKWDVDQKPNSVGAPPKFFEMKIVDDNGYIQDPGEVGEIVGRSPIVMTEYYKDPVRTSETIKDGWLYTGDMGYVDDDGYLYLVDRKKDLIISGGVNVYPNDIEDIFYQHEAVQQVAVFGIPDDQWGETPVAAVILEDHNIKPDYLRKWVNKRVSARYQKVKDVVVLNTFPLNIAGKTLRRSIKESYIKSKLK